MAEERVYYWTMGRHLLSLTLLFLRGVNHLQPPSCSAPNLHRLSCDLQGLISATHTWGLQHRVSYIAPKTCSLPC